MIETVRARLTIWYVTILAVMLVVVGGLIYALVVRALYGRVDDTLEGVTAIAITSLTNDLAEGQDTEDAARATAAELAFRNQMLAIFDGTGRLLAVEERDEDLEFELPALESIPTDGVAFLTIPETDGDDRHRLAVRRATVGTSRADYIVVVGADLESTDDELESLGKILAYGVLPIALMTAGVGGRFLARRSLSPVATMAERARRIGVDNLGARLPVANPHDELGQLATTFNELLERLELSLTQQRRFMADASHELRTPVATARTAASVALRQPQRSEREYREALEIVEQQTVRLSRIVEDMFTLTRADSGNYPVQQTPMYLDEVVDEVVRAARVLASPRGVSVEATTTPSASYTGDEDLVRRLIGNLLDNAVRYAPAGSSVRTILARTSVGYTISVRDHGPGIPSAARPFIFDRFYRGQPPGGRGGSDLGAGLGLALARWIADVHGGEITLAESSELGTTFVVDLPTVGTTGPAKDSDMSRPPVELAGRRDVAGFA